MKLRQRLILLSMGSVFALASPAFAEGSHWSYEGHAGPAAWASLSPEFGTCKLGGLQSPIDIRSAKVANLPAIKFDYKPAPLKIIDNGHTIQVNYAPGSSIDVGGARYELVQFHFHRPSEEKINGKAHAMVVHLVHRDAAGKLAVVAVLLDKGGASELIDTLWKNIPKEKEREAGPPA
jgi:carbonic anhydrase